MMALNPRNVRALCCALGIFVLLVGCAATTLDVGAGSPGYSGQPTSAAPRSRVLEPDFDPAKLTPGEPALVPPTAAPSSAVVYQCPMHPEVKRDAPGRCPICGMDLKPHAPGHNAEHSSP